MLFQTNMQFNYQGHSLKSGIYKLTNITNDRIYIGSCKEFKARWSQHEKSLQTSKHTNTFLLNDFNKCGTEAFVFEVLEVVEGTKEERLAREQFYIDQLYDKQKQCYNIRKEAVSREGSRNKQPYVTTHVCTNETRDKISENSKKMWSTRSNEDRSKMAATMASGRTKETYEKVSQKLTGRVLSPEHAAKARETGQKSSLARIGKENKWGHHTLEAIEKIKQAGRGRIKSAQTIAKMSGENHWTTRQNFSAETKTKCVVAMSKNL